jgi:hypothetical protein
MSFSSTFTRTNDTTTISINIMASPNTVTVWEMTSDGFGGSVTVMPVKTDASTENVEPVKPVKAAESVKPVKPVEPVKVTEPVKAVTEADKIKHVTAIKDMLNECEEAKGKDNKEKIAIKLLDYVSGEALDFTKSHERFKDTVINKCYEFKQSEPDRAILVAKSDNVLTKLGASTTIPDGWKKTEKCRVCCGNHATPALSKELNEVITTWEKSQSPVVAPKPVEPKPTEAKKEDTSALDLTLFTALAKKYNFKRAIVNPKAYLSYFESAVRWNSSTVKGSTKAEKMTNYFIHCTDDGQRIELMKTIFKKHNLIFSDAAMTLYNEWQKTYKPTGKTNRYIKMNEFATAHKALFTA